jgi:hypothetical protein
MLMHSSKVNRLVFFIAESLFTGLIERMRLKSPEGHCPILVNGSKKANLFPGPAVADRRMRTEENPKPRVLSEFRWFTTL